jgi:hypothetical protein
MRKYTTIKKIIVSFISIDGNILKHLNFAFGVLGG